MGESKYQNRTNIDAPAKIVRILFAETRESDSAFARSKTQHKESKNARLIQIPLAWRSGDDLKQCPRAPSFKIYEVAVPSSKQVAVLEATASVPLRIPLCY